MDVGVVAVLVLLRVVVVVVVVLVLGLLRVLVEALVVVLVVQLLVLVVVNHPDARVVRLVHQQTRHQRGAVQEGIAGRHLTRPHLNLSR